MAKFVFNFEQLLDIKRKMENQAQMTLGKRIQELEDSVQKLKKSKQLYDKSIREFELSLNKGRIDPLEIQRLNHYIGYFKNQIHIGEKEVIQKENAVKKAKEEVKKALQERKTYEILKDKAYEAYLEAEKQQEAKTIDEIVSFKYKEER